MSQDALGQLKHLKTARARWPFPDAAEFEEASEAHGVVESGMGIHGSQR